MIRPILRLGESVLEQPAAPVAAVTQEIVSLVDDMIETMYAAPGIGLAAPQVGVPLRIFVIDLSVGRDPAGLRTMINPEWVERDGMQLHLQWQGPEQWEAKIDRPTYRFPVSDVDQLHSEYQSRVRAVDITTVWDTDWGTREFHVRDPDRNGLQFYVSRSA